MPFFNSDGVSIHYEVSGAGQPVVLIHGFSSSYARNWVAPGWVEFLTRHGFQVIGLDVRGHGESQKSYDPQDYRTPLMAGDVLNLMDHLALVQPDLMGYSMGGNLSLYLLIYHGGRFRRAVVGGVGDGALNGRAETRNAAQIADALETTTPQSIADPLARQFRQFAERTNNDLRVLAAVMRRPGWPSEPERVRRIDRPVLIVAGEQDEVVSGTRNLAEAIGGARLVTIPDRNHLTVVGDPRFKDAMLDFLSEA
ncbi:MAG: alpha/beta hydrolase [Chloroflexi bacterium]|nr:alpha/beta hydrolase [Chloroflexota bacterium]